MDLQDIIDFLKDKNIYEELLDELILLDLGFVDDDEFNINDIQFDKYEYNEFLTSSAYICAKYDYADIVDNILDLELKTNKLYTHDCEYMERIFYMVLDKYNYKTIEMFFEGYYEYIYDCIDGEMIDTYKHNIIIMKLILKYDYNLCNFKYHKNYQVYFAIHCREFHCCNDLKCECNIPDFREIINIILLNYYYNDENYDMMRIVYEKHEENDKYELFKYTECFDTLKWILMNYPDDVKYCTEDNKDIIKYNVYKKRSEMIYFRRYMRSIK